jgi:hypothetical protein
VSDQALQEAKARKVAAFTRAGGPAVGSPP